MKEKEDGFLSWKKMIVDEDRLNGEIDAFFHKHTGYHKDRDWAMATGEQTMDGLWKREDMPPDVRVWIATRKDVLDFQTVRKFSSWCLRDARGKINSVDFGRAIESIPTRQGRPSLSTEKDIWANALLNLATAEASESGGAIYYLDVEYCPKHAAMAVAWADADEEYADGFERKFNESITRQQNGQADWLIKNATPTFS